MLLVAIGIAMGLSITRLMDFHVNLKLERGSDGAQAGDNAVKGLRRFLQGLVLGPAGGRVIDTMHQELAPRSDELAEGRIAGMNLWGVVPPGVVPAGVVPALFDKLGVRSVADLAFVQRADLDALPNLSSTQRSKLWAAIHSGGRGEQQPAKTPTAASSHAQAEEAGAGVKSQTPAGSDCVDFTPGQLAAAGARMSCAGAKSFCDVADLAERLGKICPVTCGKCEGGGGGGAKVKVEGGIQGPPSPGQRAERERAEAAADEWERTEAAADAEATAHEQAMEEPAQPAVSAPAPGLAGSGGAEHIRGQSAPGRSMMAVNIIRGLIVLILILIVMLVILGNRRASRLLGVGVAANQLVEPHPYAARPTNWGRRAAARDAAELSTAGAGAGAGACVPPGQRVTGAVGVG
jgi:hypothetical protein